MLPRSNRTLICSVVFLDIVEYSKKPVSEQIQLKERLNELLGETLKDVAANDRIILDTGDGVAVNFIGDPEDALFTCLSLRDAVKRPQPGEGVQLQLRAGINLGPVKLIKDLNGQPNLIGDGINVAQRVMGFAAPNEILVSRSYYEVVSCLSDAYATLFQYQGSRTDKHVREHEVYAVGESSQELKGVLDPARAAAHGPHNGFAAPTSVMARLERTAFMAQDNLRRRPRLGTAAAVAAILVIAVALRGLREPSATPVEKPTAVVTAPVAVPPVPDKAATRSPAPNNDVTTPASSPPPKKKANPPVAAAAPAPVNPADKSAASEPPKKGDAPPATAKREIEDAPRPAAAKGTGLVTLTITPWGEIHVDGKLVGEVPPIFELRLSPGKHRIEIRNPEYLPYVQTVDVSPGATIPIRHWFHK